MNKSEKLIKVVENIGDIEVTFKYDQDWRKFKKYLDSNDIFYREANKTFQTVVFDGDNIDFVDPETDHETDEYDNQVDVAKKKSIEDMLVAAKVRDYYISVLD